MRGENLMKMIKSRKRDKILFEHSNLVSHKISLDEKDPRLISYYNDEEFTIRYDFSLRDVFYLCDRMAGVMRGAEIDPRYYEIPHFSIHVILPREVACDK